MRNQTAIGHEVLGENTYMRLTIEKLYRMLIAAGNSLQPVFLLMVRLYWGIQFIGTGWGKLHHLDKVTSFFTDLGIPAPGLNAAFISGLELVGGALLVIGLASRPIALLMTCNMLVAYITADREALMSIFSDPGKFYGATPYTFLFASLIILIFGPGRFSADAILGPKLVTSKQ
ncbi:MAG TPA: DoxX family protein [Bryobacteraceae bacterium]|jgi:putative oxidoreductase